MTTQKQAYVVYYCFFLLYCNPQIKLNWIWLWSAGSKRHITNTISTCGTHGC